MTTTAAQVLGANLRALRAEHGLALDDVARAVRPFGMNWGTGRVTMMETGQGSATVEVLVALSLGLTAVTGETVTTVDLLRSSGSVELGEGVALEPTALLEVVTGQRGEVEPGEVLGSPSTPAVEGVDEELVAAAWAAWATTDTRAARRLGMDQATYLGACLRTWGRLLSQEVDARVEEGASPQRRGRVTRGIVDELTATQGTRPRA